MLKRLDEDDYLAYTKYYGLKLNPKGKNLANEIRQKHTNLQYGNPSQQSLDDFSFTSTM